MVSTCKRVKLDPYAIHKKETHMEYSVKCDVKLLEENRKKPHDIGLCNDLMDMTTKA